MIHSFPLDIRNEILFRLPVKSLIRCTSVCKTWKSIIKNPSFIHAHLTQTVNFNNQNGIHFLLRHSVSGKDRGIRCLTTIVDKLTEEVYSVHYDNQDFEEYSKIELPLAPKEELLNSHLRVVSSSNGLVCLADDVVFCGHNFFIWNPIIRKLVTLPRPGVTIHTHGGYDACIGFCFDAMTNDYKVVRVITLSDVEKEDKDEASRTIAEMYSLTTGLWSSLGTVASACVICRTASQTFVKGTLHWPVLRRKDDGGHYFILTFDVGSGLFGELSMPKRYRWSVLLGLRLSLSVDQKSIALFTMRSMIRDRRCLVIWVMKEYGIKESWTKLISLGPQGPERLLPRALCFRKSGEVLLLLTRGYPGRYLEINTKNHDFVSLNLESKQLKNIGFSGYHYYSFDSYQESLLLLDKTEAVSY